MDRGSLAAEPHFSALALEQAAAAGEGACELTLINDEQYQDCLVYDLQFTRQKLAITKMLQQRADGVSRTLAESNSLAVVLIQDFPQIVLPRVRFDYAHPRLFQLVLEWQSIQPAQRALNRYLIVPYVAKANPFLRSPENLSDAFFLYFKGGASARSRSPGIRFRAHVLAGLAELGPHLATAPQCSICNGTTAHDALLREMASARFCLVLPGDTPSSRRLSEVMASGCIPVFAGVPWHTTPLWASVDYAAFAVFFRMSHTPWLNATSGVSALFDPARNATWLPDPLSNAFLAGDSSDIIRVDNMAALVAHLRSIPDARLVRMRKAAARYRHFFVYFNGDDSSSRGRPLPKAAAAQTAGPAILGVVCTLVAPAAAA
jgi:hypothetical protein